MHQLALMFRVGTKWKDGDMESSDDFICMGMAISISHLNVDFYAFGEHVYLIASCL